MGFDLKKLLKRKYILFICLGMFVLISSFCYFNQRVQTMNSMKEIIASKRIELKGIHFFKTQHPDVENYKKYLQRENEIASSLLPEKYEEKEFLKSLNQFSKSIKIVNVTLPTKQDVVKLKQDNLQVYYAKIQIQGDYYDILRLFKELEEQHFLLQKIKIKADKTGYLDVNLNIGRCVINK